MKLTRRALACTALLVVAATGAAAGLDGGPRQAGGTGSARSPDAADAYSAALQQRIDDARAAVREQWIFDGQQIGEAELAYKCAVVDEWSASIAVRRVQVRMRDELNEAGLAGDPTMHIEEYSNAALLAGKQTADKGGCARLKPGVRHHLLSTVSALVR